MDFFKAIEEAQAEMAKWPAEKRAFYENMPCLTCGGRGFIALWDRAGRCHCNPEPE